MTSGKKLKQDLGLSKFKYAIIQKMIELPLDVLIITIDSRFPNVYIPTTRIHKLKFASLQRLKIVGKNIRSKVLRSTIPQKLEDYARNISSNTIILLRDLAGEYYLNKKMYEQNISKIKIYKILNEKNWIKIKFDENLRFSDLMKKASLSSFSKKFATETNKLMGAPTTHIKIKSIKVNKKKDYITFVWKTKRTPKYDKKSKMKVVDPKNGFKLRPARVYTIEIRILDFFKLLQTKPDYKKEELTNQDIEDVLKEADVMVWSNVPAFQYQGMNYNMTMFDAAIHPENRSPKYWNKHHNEDQFLDKHTAGLINSIKFYIPQMRMMIKKYLGITKKR